MSIVQLRINQLRNIEQAELELRRINLLCGANGSGKTSVLEALFVLGSGRSFRATRLDPVIRHDAPQCTVFATLAEGAGAALVPIGVSRDREGNFTGRIQGHEIRNAADLARRLPVQLINSDTFDLLSGGPKVRRQFLDWGVFHVEQGFHRLWLDVHRCLRQRNALLRRDRLPASELGIWDQRLAECAAQLDELRQRYFDAFRPVFHETLRELTRLDGLELQYLRGWDRESGLASVLSAQLERDRERGFTHSGPHRADVRVRMRGLQAAEVLSRGQQKLVVAAMKLAQARMFSAHQGRDCVFLVDDLPAELDRDHRRLLCRALSGMRCQVVLSCVEPAELAGCWEGLADDELRMFHVEQGALSVLNGRK